MEDYQPDDYELLYAERFNRTIYNSWKPPVAGVDEFLKHNVEDHRVLYLREITRDQAIHIENHNIAFGGNEDEEVWDDDDENVEWEEDDE